MPRAGALRMGGSRRSYSGDFEMRTPDQYREFAASEAKTEAQKNILREMARAWNEVAEAVETGRQS